MQVAIIIGHSFDSQGASSPYGIPPEWTYNLYVATLLPIEHQGIKIDWYFYDDFNNGYNNTVINKSKEINKKGYDAVLELHYNSFYNRQANGTEACYYVDSKNGKMLADAFCSNVSDAFGTFNRGAKPLSGFNDRGFASVYYYSPPAIICEPFFGTNKLDCERFICKHNEYKNCLLSIISETIPKFV